MPNFRLSAAQKDFIATLACPIYQEAVIAIRDILARYAIVDTVLTPEIFTDKASFEKSYLYTRFTPKEDKWFAGLDHNLATYPNFYTILTGIALHAEFPALDVNSWKAFQREVTISVPHMWNEAIFKNAYIADTKQEAKEFDRALAHLMGSYKFDPQLDYSDCRIRGSPECECLFKVFLVFTVPVKTLKKLK